MHFVKLSLADLRGISLSVSYYKETLTLCVSGFVTLAARVIYIGKSLFKE